MTDMKGNTSSLRPPQQSLPTPLESPVRFGSCFLLSALLPGTQATMWFLPDDQAKREKILIDSVEQVMASIGYIPIGYVTVASVMKQLEEDTSTDRVAHASNERVLEALRFQLKKENRPAGFDACYGELVRAAAAKLKAEPESSER